MSSLLIYGMFKTLILRHCLTQQKTYKKEKDMSKHRLEVEPRKTTNSKPGVIFICGNKSELISW
jgi:hypothetical protein